MDLILIRHPEVAVLPGTCYGSSDVPLRHPPHASALMLANKLSAFAVSPTVIHTSPLRRCSTVAEALGASLSRKVQIDARLAEMDFGDWEMKAWDDIPRAQLDDWAADVAGARPHGGENAVMLAQRVGEWLAAIQSDLALGAGFGADNHGCAARRSCEVTVAHAGVIRVLTALALGLPILTCLQWQLEMNGACWLRHSGGDHGHWSLVRWNV